MSLPGTISNPLSRGSAGMSNLIDPKKKLLPGQPTSPTTIETPRNFIDPGMEMKAPTTSPTMSFPGMSTPSMTADVPPVSGPQDPWKGWDSRIGSGPINPGAGPGGVSPDLPIPGPSNNLGQPIQPPDAMANQNVRTSMPIGSSIGNISMNNTPGPNAPSLNPQQPAIITPPSTSPQAIYEAANPAQMTMRGNPAPSSTPTYEAPPNPNAENLNVYGQGGTTGTPGAGNPGGAAATDGLNGQISGLLSDLLAGKSPALDFAKNTTINAAERGSRDAVAAAGQRAASLGFAQGSPEYEKLIQDAKGQASSQGTAALADVTQKGLDSQQQALSQASSFGLGQQNFGLNALKNSQDQSLRGNVLDESKKQSEMKNLDTIISDPTSSVGQVDAAKKRKGELLGMNTADLSGWARPDDSDPQNTLKYLKSQIQTAHPEYSPEQIEQQARTQYGQLTDAQFQGLLAAANTDLPGLLTAGKTTPATKTTLNWDDPNVLLKGLFGLT